MKLLIAFSLLVAVASASVKPSLSMFKDKLPLVPLMPLAELEGRITNGELAVPGQFPYQVGLSLVFGDSGAWCGGSLISDRWVVTAAHCADGADGVTVYLGATDRKNIDEEGQQRVYSSKKYITVHEGWDSDTLTNDIALIKFPVPIDFTDKIQPVALPKKSSTYSTYEGEQAIASGWGKDSDESSSAAQYLSFVEVPIMPYRQCNIYFFGSITDKMICIDTEGHKSTCNGDSGGPLVYKDGDTSYLIGATSFGIIFGCEKGWPGVFTRITSYLDWIEEKTGVSNV